MDGEGNLTTQSSVLNKTQYSFGSIFEDGTGTNPEELVAAAHAAGNFQKTKSALKHGLLLCTLIALIVFVGVITATTLRHYANHV